MNANTQPWRRDPKNPGAPIIPRGEWDFPPYHRWTFQHVREMVPTAEIWRGPGPVLPLPERDQEIEVLRRHATGFSPRDLAGAGVTAVADRGVLDAARDRVANVQVAPEVLGYAVDLCRATRMSPSLSLGVSPRGATALLATSRAWAWLSGRDYVTPDDVKALAHPTLRHRVQVRPEAELEGVTAETVLSTVLANVPVPR